MTSRSSFTLMTLIAGMLASVAAPGHAQLPLPETSLAQANPTASTGSPGLNRQPSRSYVLIYVNAIAGSDVNGNGTQMSPLKTITHALQNASPNTVIVLAPGEYSEATGESFPLQLKSGVTVQGMPGPGRNTVVIRGSGAYLSPSRGLENSTIVAADRSGLGNVVVMNPHAQGTGVWIEMGSPVLRDNVFAGSGRTGIYVAGAGTPVIQRNYFTENGSAGLIIGGPSQAQVQGNVFEKTGVGIQVAPGAEPRILENRVVQNQDGIILQANARPVLENNQISGNRRNGLVEFQALAEDRVLSRTVPAREVEIASTAPTLPAMSTGSYSTSPAQISSVTSSPVTSTNPSPISSAAVTSAPPATVESGPAVGASIETEPPKAQSLTVAAASRTASSPVENRPSRSPQTEGTAATQGILPQLPPATATTALLPQSSPLNVSVSQPTSEVAAETPSDLPTPTTVAEPPSAPETPVSASTVVVPPTQSPALWESQSEEPAIASNPVAPTVSTPVAPGASNSVTPSSRPSSAIAELRQQLLARQTSSSEAPTTPASAAEAVELAVIPPSTTATSVTSRQAAPEPRTSESQSEEPAIASNPVAPRASNSVTPSSRPSSAISELRQQLLANRQAASTSTAETPTSPAADAVELAVIPPATPAASAASGQSSPEQRNLAAIRARILANRSNARAASAENANTSAGGTDATASSLPVSLPPIEVVARARTEAVPTPAESLPLIPTERSLPTTPPANLSSPPRPEPSSDILRVPSANIPLGSGGSMPEILLTSAGTAVGGPPSLPSRAAILGLRYKVFVNAPDEATQTRVKTAVPDAFRVRFNGQVMMQAGAFSDQATADAIANNLTQQGLEARVEYVE
ncbi:MAG TPA: DUF1565 domain-containing protein [Trichocoleus sp.]